MIARVTRSVHSAAFCLFYGVLAWSAANAAPLERVEAVKFPAEEQIKIDGVLDDAAWQRATAYPLRFKFSPTTVETTIPETTFRILVDGETLYIGIDCKDPSPGAIRRELSHRDSVEGADSVKVWIDPDGRRKFAQIFKVAAGGAIWDGTFYEDSGREDKSPDFAFEAMSAIHGGGWSAELKIPASSLRFNGKGQPTILVTRYYPRGNGFVFAATEIDNRHQCILCKNPILVGLETLKRSSALTVTPYVSAIKDTGDFGNALKGRAGVDVKWRLSDATVVDATINPDFSQVELDTPQLAANSAYALFFPEKRPFFLEGLDFFDTPLRAVYTRTYTRPSWGARLTHRGEGAEAVALATRDDGGGLVLLPGPFTTDAATQPAATAAVARTRFHALGGRAGAFAALKDYGDSGSNLVGGGDLVYTMPNDRFNAQVVLSRTTALPSGSGFAKGDAQNDDAEYLAWKHDSSTWHARTILRRTGNRFRDDSGFFEANGLYDGEFFVGRDLKRSFGWDEILTYVFTRHKETLDGETIAGDYGPGVDFEGGAGNRLEVLLLPVSVRRVAPGSKLHRISFVDANANYAPAGWLPQLEVYVTAGERVDTLSDRVGTGYSVQVYPIFLFDVRWRIGTTLAQEYIAASNGAGQRRVLLRDSIAALNVSYFFDPINELRVTYQHGETHRDPLAFSVPITKDVSSDLLSLVYTWTPSLGKAFYAGGTWSSAATPTRAEGAEFFIKMSWAFDL